MGRIGVNVLIGLLTLCAFVISLTGTVAAADDGGAFFGLWFLAGMFCLVIPVLLLVIRILILIWVYKDAKSRGMSGVVWLLVVFFLGLIGLIVYLIVRRKK